MKLTTSLLLLAFVSISLAAPSKKDKDDDDSGIDVEEVLGNRRLLIPYIKCALDQGKCSSSGKDMKDHIRESLETDCAKCTPRQKKDNKLVFKHLINKEKDYWKQLVAKYDADRQYAPKFEARYLGKD